MTARSSATSRWLRDASFAAARGIEASLRFLGSVFMFGVFGLGAVVLAAVVIPAVRVFHRGRKPRDLVAQFCIHRAFANYVRLGEWLRLWSVEGTGVERLRDGPCVIVANHPSLIDVVVLLAQMPQGDCIVKREIWRNPALGAVIRSSGYVPNDLGEGLVEACVQRLMLGRSVVFFPEGSRSPSDGLRPFKRGAARVALRSGCPIIPVTIDCQPRALSKQRSWYAFPHEKLRFSVRVGEPIRAKDVVSGDLSQASAARRINSWLRKHIEDELRHGIANAAGSGAQRADHRGAGAGGRHAGGHR